MFSLLAHIRSKLIERAVKSSLAPLSTVTGARMQVHTLLQKQFAFNAPLRVYSLNASSPRRINLVTDSVGQGSLFGGVGTALIFGALLANRLNATLRIITRTERAQAQNLRHILDVHHIALIQEVQFAFAPFFDNHYEVDVSEKDLFITTSWWTTQATLSSVPAQKVIYLLQEDERMFYAHGDDRMRASNVMERVDIQFLINTKLLYDHLISEGFEHFKSCAQWFEPSFAPHHYPNEKCSEDGAENTKHRFFFYARPNNPRNLFYLGIQVIEKAICEGVLDPEHWELVLVGKDIPNVVFSGDVVPLKLENLSWKDYMEMVDTIDLGLSLMSTPHPSYPPLDLANAGAVVVTNRYGLKTDLSHYSANILCAEPKIDELMKVLRKGVELALSKEVRAKNHAKNNFLSSWQLALSKVIECSIERLHVSN